MLFILSHGNLTATYLTFDPLLVFQSILTNSLFILEVEGFRLNLMFIALQEFLIHLIFFLLVGYLELSKFFCRHGYIVVIEIHSLYNDKIIPVNLGQLVAFFFFNLLFFLSRLAFHIIPLETFRGAAQDIHSVLDILFQLEDIVFFWIETIVIGVYQVGKK
jgi:hypothetical protein